MAHERWDLNLGHLAIDVIPLPDARLPPAALAASLAPLTRNPEASHHRYKYIISWCPDLTPGQPHSPAWTDSWSTWLPYLRSQLPETSLHPVLCYLGVTDSNCQCSGHNTVTFSTLWKWEKMKSREEYISYSLEQVWTSLAMLSQPMGALMPSLSHQSCLPWHSVLGWNGTGV